MINWSGTDRTKHIFTAFHNITQHFTAYTWFADIWSVVWQKCVVDEWLSRFRVVDSIRNIADNNLTHILIDWLQKPRFMKRARSIVYAILFHLYFSFLGWWIGCLSLFREKHFCSPIRIGWVVKMYNRFENNFSLPFKIVTFFSSNMRYKLRLRTVSYSLGECMLKYA